MHKTCSIQCTKRYRRKGRKAPRVRPKLSGAQLCAVEFAGAAVALRLRALVRAAPRCSGPRVEALGGARPRKTRGEQLWIGGMPRRQSAVPALLDHHSRGSRPKDDGGRQRRHGTLRERRRTRAAAASSSTGASSCGSSAGTSSSSTLALGIVCLGAHIFWLSRAAPK